MRLFLKSSLIVLLSFFFTSTIALADTNSPPVANAGPDLEMYEAEYRTFDGTNSSDPDGQTDIISYHWDFGDGNSADTPIAYHNYVEDDIYTATLTVTDSVGNTSSDNITVTVNHLAPNIGGWSVTPTEALPGDTINAFATFGSQGINNTHTATFDWGDGVTTNGIVTEDNGSGSVVSSHVYITPGVYTVTLTVTDDQNASTSSTSGDAVNILEATTDRLISLDSPKVWIGLKNSDSVGVKFDLRAEVYKDDVQITSGELNSFNGGSSGFNNANLATIPLNSFNALDFPPESQLKLSLYVRNACAGSGHNSGVARLWYGDSAANSRINTSFLSGSTNYLLLNNFILGASSGLTKKKIDVQSGAKCSDFKPFGTWVISI